jgi:hypothetical protein
MIAEDLILFFLFAIMLTIPVLAAITAKSGDAPKSTPKKHHMDLRAFKECPHCADQLPLSTLVCDACDYNFLSRAVGLRHKLLPAPDAERLSA